MKHRLAPVLLAVGLVAGAVPAQLADLQPGRNFPTATVAFGARDSSQIDSGDIDLDGDPDLVIGNGYASADPNEIHVNLGGLQGGSTGTFADESATRFGVVYDEMTRDVELVDWDGDCDLDLLETAWSSLSLGGGVARAWLNTSGRQLGPAGHFAEVTDDFWGQLVSVPACDQVFGGDQGPFREFSCDCEFGDLDLDGDPDLLFTTYGPNINGTRDTRVFLNDGDGRFDELWPWADAAADTQLHTIDADLADLDDDWDLDIVASSRDSQARIYRNDLDLATGSWPAEPFTDVTQSAFLDTGATVSGNGNYEVEFGDVDGDGDFDLWMTNYQGFADRILVNDGGLAFTEAAPQIIRADPQGEEEHAGFTDYDNDGDLDCFQGNFSGTNWIFQSGLVQGTYVGGIDLYHRTGVAVLSPAPETPASSNGGTTIDADIVDLDGDGDEDFALVNQAGQHNRRWDNVLGVPDTHAPTIHQLTLQADKGDGSDTPIRVQLRDNSGMPRVSTYAVDLFASVDGGLEARLPMRPQGGQQFAAVIPGGWDGTIAYRVVARDAAGNTVASAGHGYVQSATGPSPLQPVDDGTPGTAGTPHLALGGSFVGGAPVHLALCEAPAGALAVWFVSLASTPLPFKGGLLHTVPITLSLSLTTDDAGLLWLEGPWPGGVPTGTQVWNQLGVADPGATGGAVLSNAVLLTTP